MHNFIVSLIVLIGFSCSNEKNLDKKCDALKECKKKFTIGKAIGLLINVDSFYNDNNFSFYYKLKLLNKTDSAIVVKIIQQKDDKKFYLPLLFKDYNLDSCQCELRRDKGYHEFFGAAQNFIIINKDESKSFEGYTFYDHPPKSIYVFSLYFEYYYGINDYKNRITREKESFWVLKQNKIHTL